MAAKKPPLVVEQEYLDARPNPLAVYAKAVVAYLVTAVASITSWSAVVGDGPLDRTALIGLGAAIVGPLAAAFGVALTTNADALPDVEDDAGVTALELIVCIVIAGILLALIFGAFH